MNLNKFFLEYCKSNKFEVNQDQFEIIDHLKSYYKDNFNQSFLKKIYKKKKCKVRFLPCW